MGKPVKYFDRYHAGWELSTLLKKIITPDTVVYGLPKGGAMVGAVVAHAFRLPFQVIGVKRITASDDSDCAIGAVTGSGFYLLHSDVNILTERFELIKARCQKAAVIDERILGRMCSSINGQPKQIVVVDDGIATGLTMKTAIASLRKNYPESRIIAAVPITLGLVGEQWLGCDKLFAYKRSTRQAFVGMSYWVFGNESRPELRGFLKRLDFRKMSYPA